MGPFCSNGLTYVIWSKHFWLINHHGACNSCLSYLGKDLFYFCLGKSLSERKISSDGECWVYCSNKSPSLLKYSSLLVCFGFQQLHLSFFFFFSGLKIRCLSEAYYTSICQSLMTSLPQCLMIKHADQSIFSPLWADVIFPKWLAHCELLLDCLFFNFTVSCTLVGTARYQV